MTRRQHLVLWGVDISQGALAAGLLKFFYPRIPFIFTLQYGESRERIAHGRAGLIAHAYQFLLTYADGVTAISSYLARSAEEFGYKKQVVIIPNGVDIEKFKVQSLKQAKRKQLSRFRGWFQKMGWTF